MQHFRMETSMLRQLILSKMALLLSSEVKVMH